MNRRGFTLIETVISVVIILVGVIGLFTVITNSIAARNAPQSFEIAAGAQYVQEGLERVYADRRNPDRGFDYIIPGNHAADPTPPLNGFTRTWTVEPWGGQPQTEYRQVTVTVSRNGRVVATGALLVAAYTW